MHSCFITPMDEWYVDKTTKEIKLTSAFQNLIPIEELNKEDEEMKIDPK